MKDLDDIAFEKSKHPFPFNLFFLSFLVKPRLYVSTGCRDKVCPSYHTYALLYITLMSSKEWHYDVKSLQIVSVCCIAMGNQNWGSYPLNYVG